MKTKVHLRISKLLLCFLLPAQQLKFYRSSLNLINTDGPAVMFSPRAPMNQAERMSHQTNSIHNFKVPPLLTLPF
ncbi:hypothetical protein IWZ01DRAFT_254098 [Phyllosticta capitalensis]